MVAVRPDVFTLVAFEPGPIAELFDDLAARVPGLPDLDNAVIEVDQDKPTTRVALTSIDPPVFSVDSGALENTKQPRTFGAQHAGESLGRLLFELADRTDPDFGAPAVGEPTDLARKVAWDAYCFGRLSRLGHRIHKPRHLYNFRNRHGFSDAADATFEQLWSATNLTWADIEAVCPPLDA